MAPKRLKRPHDQVMRVFGAIRIFIMIVRGLLGILAMLALLAAAPAYAQSLALKDTWQRSGNYMERGDTPRPRAGPRRRLIWCKPNPAPTVSTMPPTSRT
jgi:hypothetical protein